MEILKVTSPEGVQIKADYAIYPSLMDAYLRFKRHDDDETFDSLFCKINKIKSEQTESQLKGVEFEKCVNDLLSGVVVEKTPDGLHFKAVNFLFPVDLITRIVDKLKPSIGKQKYLEVIIKTQVGIIRLYGIIDFEFPEMIVDLKGTSNYKCNKYKDHMQHPVYSFIRHLNNEPIKAFKYVVSDYFELYQETYIPGQNMYDKLMITIFEFINFINHYKSFITDKTIFGGEEVSDAE